MSHITAVKLDPGENQPIIIRKARRANLTFKFWTDSAFTVPYNIEDDFKFSLFRNSRDKRNPLIEAVNTGSADLEITDNQIVFPFDEDNSDIDLRTAYYELQNTTTVQNWLQGEATILTGETPDSGETEVNRQINLNGTTVNVQITVAGFDVASLTDAQLQELAELLLAPLHPTADTSRITADNTSYRADNN